MPADAAPAPRIGGFNRAAAITRSLLGYGVLVGPFYLVVGIVQGLVRPGFSFARHPLSVLANGPGGWVQTTNFVLSGLMVIAAAVGFRRVIGREARALSVTLGFFGVSMIAASILRADPMDGFPVGTPLGPPTTMSSMGLGHFAAGGLGFVALGVSGLLAWRVMSRRNEQTMAMLSLVSGISVFGGFFGGFIVPALAGNVAGIWFAVAVGWLWLALLSRHLYRVAPSPNC